MEYSHVFFWQYNVMIGSTNEAHCPLYLTGSAFHLAAFCENGAISHHLLPVSGYSWAVRNLPKKVFWPQLPMWPLVVVLAVWICVRRLLKTALLYALRASECSSFLTSHLQT
jgi:hypothetical protein